MTQLVINPPPRYFNVSSPAEYVAHVEINRPEKLNAFAPPMWNELRQIFEQLSVNPDLRAVIISGAGEKAFTAGMSRLEFYLYSVGTQFACRFYLQRISRACFLSGLRRTDSGALT
jgi:enoyl-CoA hydratase/carnithine racemase